jgi:hypothetical protein
MTENVDKKKDESRKKMFLALSGSMVALGSATIGYLMFGLIGGFGFVLTLFGFMWYLQTQLESTIEQIEIKVRND